MAIGALLVLSAAVAAPEPALVARNRASPLPERLVRLGRTPPDAVLPSLDIALASQDYPGLQRSIEAVSDPESPRYGQWLTPDEVTTHVAATPESIAAVREWVASAGLAEAATLTQQHDWLILKNVTAAEVERLLGAELFQHRDEKTGQEVPRLPGGYLLPGAVAPHVLHIQPIHSVPAATLGGRQRTPADLRAGVAAWPHDCVGLEKAGMITPAVVRARYNFSDSPGKPQGSIAAMLPGPIGVLASEVAYIQKDCGLPDHPLSKFVGKNAVAACSKTGKKLNDDTCAESAIDSQIQATNAPLGIHQEFWAEDCGGFTCTYSAKYFS